MIEPYTISQKCRYALRAIFELSIRSNKAPVKIQEIAGAQSIPPRFLEVILSELKHGGFVESRRGKEGGYILAQPANKLTVGEVIGFIQGNGVKSDHKEPDLMGKYAFLRLWQDISNSISNIYNNTTFADLIKEELSKRKSYIPNYVI